MFLPLLSTKVWYYIFSDLHSTSTNLQYNGAVEDLSKVNCVCLYMYVYVYLSVYMANSLCMCPPLPSSYNCTSTSLVMCSYTTNNLRYRDLMKELSCVCVCVCVCVVAYTHCT